MTSQNRECLVLDGLLMALGDVPRLSAAFVKLAHARGYRLIGDVAHVNLFFVRSDLLPRSCNEPSVKALGGRLVGPNRGDP